MGTTTSGGTGRNRPTRLAPKGLICWLAQASLRSLWCKTAPNAPRLAQNGANQFYLVMPRINLTVEDDLYQHILKHKPKSLSVAKFCSLLIEQQAPKPIDSYGTLGGPSEAGTPFYSSHSSSIDKSIEEELKPVEIKTKTRVRVREADPYKAKAVNADLVPADLLDCQQLLPEWWAVKKGVRSESVWRRVCGKLRGWTPEQRREALERAIASGWGDVFEPTPTRANSQVLSASGVPMTASEQIAASALRKIKAMEAANAPLF